MALLGTLKIDLNKVDESKIFQGKKGKYIEITVAVNDESDGYGNNISAWNGQTVEERETKTPKQYLANGKVFWTNGNVAIGTKAETSVDDMI
ncbi:hypothetical protein N8Y76_01730 [Flavobacteriaceae bacterium]|nr:hypothetical protein [Flavobacteriaceae bacterium]